MTIRKGSKLIVPDKLGDIKNKASEHCLVALSSPLHQTLYLPDTFGITIKRTMKLIGNLKAFPHSLSIYLLLNKIIKHEVLLDVDVKST